ncbi:sigma-E processing peptidase SpoIIGA [Orenia marismortui]|uniref:Sporulation sigma-E factor-processing peptidase n=1 Tax=Orenia marismortui TaxID=46469 RepID=A0A4R8H0U5_9FIRM|nr:sigma-E processing peptidase SpoIIGA [Orenia marismortui]TDX53007.1 stage II sporulation protein GA (sporulation sigma-E factor processing peptidase) [Orenia marismortui]
MKLVVYLDLLSFINLIMNYLILWASAKLSDLEYSIWRLLITSVLATVYTIIIILPQFRFLNRIYIHFLISIIMILIAFAPLSRKQLVKTIGYFYLITFVTAGAIFALYNLTGGSPLDNLAQVLNISPDNLWIIILGFLLIIIIGKFGWMFIQYKLLPDIFCIPIIIKFDERLLKVKALVDTGNQLQDPLTRVPVVVVEIEAMLDVIPDQVKDAFYLYKDDSSKLLNEMTDTPWSSRFRLIPFSSIGKHNGMLIGFRPDKITVVTKDEIFVTERVIIALQDRILDQENNYQALLNPEVLR